MNKTVFKITIFSLAVCFLTGCEDFLNKDVLGYSTDENFYDTQYKLESALNAMYYKWRFITSVTGVLVRHVEMM